MKKFLQKISVSILSLIVILSSMSFTIDKHYCGDTLVDVSYFGKADVCGMDDMKMKVNPEKMKKKKCCKNETELIESSTFDKEKITTISPEQIDFLVFHIYSYINSYEDVKIEKEYYKDFSPPDIVQDIQVLHETFLI